MDFNFFMSAMNQYNMDVLINTKVFHISDYLKEYLDADEDFLFDLILFAFNKKFMKKSYEGKYSDLNKCILNNKDSIMKELEVNYADMKQLMARDFSLCSTFKLFSEYKQIYSVDGSFMRDLVFTQSSSTSIPREIFDHLPYNSFYLDLSDSGICKGLRLEGCFIHLRSKDNMQLEIIIQLLRKPVDYDGRIYNGLVTRVITCDLDFIDFDSSDPECCINIDKNFDLDYVENILYNDLHTNDFNLVFTWFVVVPFLMYLGSYKSDIKKKSSYTKKERKIVTDNNITTSEVGYQYGYTLRSQNKSSKDNTSRITKAKISKFKLSHPNSGKRSHVRKAHWHTFRYGNNREFSRIVWMPPMFIKGNKSPNITVHNVK